MTTNLEPVQTFKILIIGDSGVGKSSLMARYVHGIFHTQYTATIGVDFQIAIINIGAYKCRLQIWDTAGQERFRSITSSYYRGVDGIIIVYDVTDSTTFTHVKNRLSDVQNLCDTGIPKILVGNKDDSNNKVNKVVPTSDAHQYAEQNNLSFFEISVKDNRNITEVFDEIARLALKRRLNQCESAQMTKVGIRIQEKQIIGNGMKQRCCTA
ncbi:unnamed protein product [Rotaria sp. Silwood2]|nr:unnamed protein product [Rotaria sp. Silwood2]CAF2689453.1 unnamed protein product [Rotaria sp. Silwood2]CAF2964214.1 unnamed protein product [Rotaria sp. Silwood2]CAF3106218.1 unnamed protein product [Rotaria sp. Silwood2]CAF3975692.1 unnamed protein product [Rotaria sp. Silwood2]